MKRIYQLNLEQETEIFRCSSLPENIGEIWFHFDSSIFIELTNYFIDRKLQYLGTDFISLVNLISKSNINILHVAVLEAARIKSKENSLNTELGISHLHAFLIAQCIDLEKSNLQTQNW